MAASILMLIMDGVGDRAVEELDGQTPLEAAETPNLDHIAKFGENGLMDTISPGIRPGSDTGHLSLLGYDPFEVYRGRGPFEAAGAGLSLEPEDVAFRCNFATEKDGIVVDRRAGRIKERRDELAEAVQEIDIGVDFQFKETIEHRCVLVLKSGGLGGDVSDIDPHEPDSEFQEAVPLVDSEENKRTANILNDFTKKSSEVLSDHPVNEEREKEGKPPANIILPRGGGKVPELKGLKEKEGLNGAAISGIALVRGVCALAGMDLIDIEGATGGIETDTEGIVEGALTALKDHDFVLVNIKGPDIAGHDGRPHQKIDIIEKIDSALEPLRDIEDTYVAITGDHSTPVTIKDHSGDPLPLTIKGKDVRTDGVQEFHERACSRGGLHRIRGSNLLDILKDLADRTEKFGA
ncbi:MAG: 2,3-bisphosphoglycerate-independent phosphoglycerate mutase [Candidatus Thermoplasmatota archaeon]|nr:2,3-bisphosphoglycerate-independent phosphoglycerate mutase [Candidatus Thermoplasmatota archaeon]